MCVGLAIGLPVDYAMSPLTEDGATPSVAHRRVRGGSVVTIPSIPELAKYKRRADISNSQNEEEIIT